jgi:hypothetical protein
VTTGAMIVAMTDVMTVVTIAAMIAVTTAAIGVSSKTC